MNEKPKLTDFGYKQVPTEDKASLVGEVFTSVASKYDIMNDVMSAGMHRLWKRWAISRADIHLGQRVLDLAGGTGDLTAMIAEKVGDLGQVVLADINNAMIKVGRDRLINKGLSNIEYVNADAQFLPFEDNSFSRITIAFGLRNVTDKSAALKEMYRVLKPAGKVIILEFSKPLSFLQKFYDAYSFNVIPKMGKLITGDEESYQYLVESIRMHPDQETLKQMMADAGFVRAQYENLTGGVVALHSGYKV
jgi:demethylmenaquinone methyltransferase/2-methoxy-6-polyprenyl-1,4-benzoquinol methylase